MAMTKGEREDLLRLVRGREKVLKSAADQRGLAMLHEFEKQMATVYSFDDDEVWAKSYEAAKEALTEAQKAIRDRCRALGIPDEFQPTVSGGHWIDRGENAWRVRRDELRRVAKAEIAAVTHSARVEIERMSIEAQTEIIAHGLESLAAKAFLEHLPTVEKLMPSIELPKIANVVENRQKRLN